MKSSWRDDAGGISVLSLGFAIVGITLVLVGVVATDLHLHRVRLLSVADEVALDAADALDVDAYYRGELPRPSDDAAIVLDDSRVALQATRALDRAARRHALQGLVLEEAYSPDGRTVVVTVSMVVRPPLRLGVLAPWSDGVRIEATSSARAW